MSSISDQFLDDLLEWAKENEDRCVFPLISEQASSYYICRNTEETYMMEYSFESVIELKAALEKYSRKPMDVQLLNKMIIAAYQNRFTAARNESAPDEQVEKSNLDDGKSELPEYIYVF